MSSMNQFFICFAILDFCLKLIFLLCTLPLTKKIYQFGTVSRTDINSKSKISGRTIMTKQTMVWKDKMKNCCGTAI
jgi:hypothetical protein